MTRLRACGRETRPGYPWTERLAFAWPWGALGARIRYADRDVDLRSLLGFDSLLRPWFRFWFGPLRPRSRLSDGAGIWAVCAELVPPSAPALQSQQVSAPASLPYPIPGQGSSLRLWQCSRRQLLSNSRRGFLGCPLRIRPDGFPLLRFVSPATAEVRRPALLRGICD